MIADPKFLQSLKEYDKDNIPEAIVKKMREKFVKPTFEQFFEECVLPGFPNMPPEAVPPGGLLTMLFFGFVNGWWPLRHKPNVLFLHFSEMKADHEGSVRKIADRVAMLHQGEIVWDGPRAQIDASGNAYVDQFVHGKAEGPISTLTGRR